MIIQICCLVTSLHRQDIGDPTSSSFAHSVDLYISRKPRRPKSVVSYGASCYSTILPRWCLLAVADDRKVRYPMGLLATPQSFRAGAGWCLLAVAYMLQMMWSLLVCR